MEISRISFRLKVILNHTLSKNTCLNKIIFNLFNETKKQYLYFDMMGIKLTTLFYYYFKM